MALPVALTIASILDPSTAEEIRETVGDTMSLIEPFSSSCTNHSNRPYCVLPSSSCSSETVSPTSDLGSEISSSSCSTITSSYSYFSDSEIRAASSPEPDFQVEVSKPFSFYVDMIGNCEARFEASYIFKYDQQGIGFQNLAIDYNGRNILDLGSNIKEDFPLTVSTPEPESITFNKYWPRIGIERRCLDESCDFEYLHPLA